MRRDYALVSALFLSLVVVGCSKTTKPAPQQQKETQASPDWSLSYNSGCDESQQDQDCLGKFGFTINSDRTFKLGPTPEGKVQTGEISATDFADLKTALQAYNEGNQTRIATENCASDDETITQSTILLGRNTGSQTLVQTNLEASEYCSENASNLQYAIQYLANKYAIMPFPSDCSNAVADAQALNESVTSCKTDADCVYLGANLDFLDGEEAPMIQGESCSKMSPLAVGNKESVTQNLEKLRAALNSVQTACGEKLNRIDCFAGDPLKAIEKPVCMKTGDRGVCKIHPAVFAAAELE